MCHITPWLGFLLILPLLLLLLLLPTARKHIVESFLKGAAVHVDQPFLLLGFRVADHGHEAQIPIRSVQPVHHRENK